MMRLTGPVIRLMFDSGTSPIARCCACYPSSVQPNSYRSGGEIDTWFEAWLCCPVEIADYRLLRLTDDFSPALRRHAVGTGHQYFHLHERCRLVQPTESVDKRCDRPLRGFVNKFDSMAAAS